MKKIIMAICIVTIGATSCAKKEVITPGSLPVSKDSTFKLVSAGTNQTATPPKAAFKVGSISATVGSIGELYFYGVNYLVEMKDNAGTTTNVGLKNGSAPYLVIKSAKDSSVIVDKVPLVGGPNIAGKVILPGAPFLIPTVADKLTQYLIEFYADVDASFRGTIAVNKVSIEYIWKTSSTTVNSPKSTSASANSFVTTFSVCNVTTVLESLDNTRVSGSAVTALKFTLRSDYQSSVGKFITIGADGSVVSKATLYSGTTIVGSATVDALKNTATITLGDMALAKSSSVPLHVVFTPKAGVGNGADIAPAILNVSYVTETGDAKINDTLRNGGTILYYKALPEYSQVALSSNKITNSTFMEFFRGNVKAMNGDISTKMIAFNVRLVDNKGNDSLSIDSLTIKWKEANITNTGIFVNASGVPITSITEADINIFWVFVGGAGEAITATASADDFSLFGTMRGFNHIADGDAFAISLATDLTPPPAGFKYLNAGTSGSAPKLFSSEIKNNSAQLFNVLWSDRSSIAHSATIGFRSADWTNGYGVVKDGPVQYLYQ